MKVPINILFNLFDSYVLSVLNYGAEVWGCINSEVIERAHNNFVNGYCYVVWMITRFKLFYYFIITN
jgi:hypothetical protein